MNKEFKRRTKAMEVTGGETTTYRLLAYVALTMNFPSADRQHTTRARGKRHLRGADREPSCTRGAEPS